LKLLAVGDVVIHRWLVQASSSPGDSSSRVHVLLADCSLEVPKKATWEQQKSKVNDGLKVNKSMVVLEICQRHRSVFGTEILSAQADVRRCWDEFCAHRMKEGTVLGFQVCSWKL